MEVQRQDLLPTAPCASVSSAHLPTVSYPVSWKSLLTSAPQTPILHLLQNGPRSHDEASLTPLFTFLREAVPPASLSSLGSLPPSRPQPHIWLLPTWLWLEGQDLKVLIDFFPGGSSTPPKSICFSLGFLDPTPPVLYPGRGYHLVPAPSVCHAVNV